MSFRLFMSVWFHCRDRWLSRLTQGKSVYSSTVFCVAFQSSHLSSTCSYLAVAVRWPGRIGTQRFFVVSREVPWIDSGAVTFASYLLSPPRLLLRSFAGLVQTVTSARRHHPAQYDLEICQDGVALRCPDFCSVVPLSTCVYPVFMYVQLPVYMWQYLVHSM